MCGGGSAVWVGVYGLIYWMTRLQLHSLSSILLYLGYLFLLCLLDFLVTGRLLHIARRYGADCSLLQELLGS